MEKQALVVGINEYSAAAPLRLAVNDAKEMTEALTMPEYDFEVSQLLNEQASKNNGVIPTKVRNAT